MRTININKPNGEKTSFGIMEDNGKLKIEATCYDKDGYYNASKSMSYRMNEYDWSTNLMSMKHLGYIITEVVGGKIIDWKRMII